MAEERVAAAENRLAQFSTETCAPNDLAANIRMTDARVDLARAEVALAEVKIAIARADVSAAAHQADPADRVSARRTLESAQTLLEIQLRALSYAHEDAQAARTLRRRSQYPVEQMQPLVQVVSDRQFAPIPKRPAHARRMSDSHGEASSPGGQARPGSASLLSMGAATGGNNRYSEGGGGGGGSGGHGAPQMSVGGRAAAADGGFGHSGDRPESGHRRGADEVCSPGRADSASQRAQFACSQRAIRGPGNAGSDTDSSDIDHRMICAAKRCSRS
jgi:multidrug efflux pump subunit AcrA (membrane-fusion protein)